MNLDITQIRELIHSVRQDFFNGALQSRVCPNAIEAAAVAAVVSMKSPCQSKRGAVLWNRRTDGRLNVGWNDQPLGFRCDGSDACKASCGKTAIHAEESIILATDRGLLDGASMIHIKTVNGELVPSGRPSCIRCSGMILESGIEWMWLLHDDGLRRYRADEFHAQTIKTLGLHSVRGAGSILVEPLATK